MIFEKIQSDGFEQIVYCNDPKVGLKGIIAIHSMVLGPATGGCRMWNYASESDAVYDVLRLSKGMTYKAAISGLNWGGGKAIIMGDPKTQKTPQLLARFGEFVDRFGGHYITAKDVGIGASDLKQIKSATSHVLGIDGESGSSGDPSPATAWGVYHGMLACAQHTLKTPSLKGLKIAIQGLGSVSYYLLEHLHREGAQIIACDIDAAMIDRAVKEYGITVVGPEEIYDVPCDIFSPCALGASVNPQTIPRIKARIIAGAANNQLATGEDGFELMRRGITYAPDYLVNAGGLINIYYESPAQGGYRKEKAFAHIQGIGKTMLEVLERAEAEKQPTHVVADRTAEDRIHRAAVQKTASRRAH
jgi:leucine dehydrogenase